MPEKLDLKDRKLLYALDTNSRASAREIAAKTGLSKDAALYRIRRLQERGIIKRFYTVIDTGKLGVMSFRLYLKLRDASPEKEREIVEHLKAQPAVGWLTSIDGPYDLGCWLMARSVAEINAFWKNLFAKYNDHIERHSLTIFTKVTYFPRSYLLEDKHNRDGHIFITEPCAESLDETDIGILRLLAEDARVSLIEIASKLQITAKTAAARIKDLERRGVIIGYRTMFDLAKLGYEHFKIHLSLRRLTPERERAIRMYIREQQNIVFDNEVLGGDNLEIEAQVRSLEELRALLGEMRTRFADIISDCWYMLFYEEHKFVFFPQGHEAKP